MKGLPLLPQTPKGSGRTTVKDSPWKQLQAGKSSMQCASKHGPVEKAAIKTPSFI